MFGSFAQRFSRLPSTLLRATLGRGFSTNRSLAMAQGLERSQPPKTLTSYKKPFSARKQYLFKTYEGQFVESPAILVLQHHNLGGQELMNLRRDLKLDAQGAKLMVVRPKMIKAVVRDTKFANMADLFNGPTALVYWVNDQGVEAQGDLISKAIKVVKEQKKCVLTGAVYENMVLNVAMLEGLVQMPGIDALRAQVLGVVQQPVQQLAGVLKRVPQRLVGVLQQKAEAEEQK
ncbi:hypothetical protein GGI07_002853 [Coemansia sp. Benny D115]|nr:hypothetical protein GGI07_002853 [Coemansia sp. Benny D115]